MKTNIKRKSSVKTHGVEAPVSDRISHESQKRRDFSDANSPEGLEVIQITTNPEFISHHLYPECHMFASDSDSERFVFHRMRTNDTNWGDYWLCDIKNNFGLRQITDEEGVKGAAMSPDGQWMYYLVDATETTNSYPGIVRPREERRLTLKRVSLGNFSRETLLTIEGTIPGTEYSPTRIYPLTSISSDGKRLCTSAFLGDGKTENAPFGPLVFDLENLSLKVVFKMKEFLNMHPQYCRSKEPLLSHDILIQHNHGGFYDLSGNLFDKNGNPVKLTGDSGADLHVISDDGSNWRDIPLGRDGINFCTGHQQWRGRTCSIVSAMLNPLTKEEHLFEAFPVVTDDAVSHKGAGIPGGKYVNLTRNLKGVTFNHFSGDLSGTRFVLRNNGSNGELEFYTATLSAGENPELKVQYLLKPKMTIRDIRNRGQASKTRAFFSPDARMVFFQTDFYGPVHIFMCKGYGHE